MTGIKVKKIDESTGYVLTDYGVGGSISFFADIPKNAIVVGIKLGDKYLDDCTPVAPIYPRTNTDSGIRIVAQVKNIYGEVLYDQMVGTPPSTFEVEYYEPYVRQVN